MNANPGPAAEVDLSPLDDTEPKPARKPAPPVTAAYSAQSLPPEQPPKPPPTDPDQDPPTTDAAPATAPPPAAQGTPTTAQAATTTTHPTEVIERTTSTGEPIPSGEQLAAASDESLDASVPLAEPRPHAARELFKASFHAYGLAAQHTGQAVKLAMIALAPALAVTLLTAWLLNYLDQTQAPAWAILAACLPEFALAVLLAGVAWRYFLFNVRIGIDNTNDQPDLSLDAGEAFNIGLKALGLQAIYILPIVTIPLYPLAVLAFAHTEDGRALDPRVALRAALRQPAAWLMLWGLILGWLIVTAAAVAVIVLIMIGLASLNGPDPNKTLAALLWLLGTGLVAAVLSTALLVPTRITGLLGYFYPNLVQMIPARPAPAASIVTTVVAVALLAVPAYTLYAGRDRVTNVHNTLLAHLGLRDKPAPDDRDEKIRQTLTQLHQDAVLYHEHVNNQKFPESIPALTAWLQKRNIPTASRYADDLSGYTFTPATGHLLIHSPAHDEQTVAICTIETIELVSASEFEERNDEFLIQKPRETPTKTPQKTPKEHPEETPDLPSPAESLLAQLLWLADHAFDRGEFQDALEKYGQALSLATKVGDDEATAMIHRRIAECEHERELDNDFASLLASAQVWTRERQFSKAVEALAEARPKRPARAGEVNALLDEIARRQQIEQAAERLESAAKLLNEKNFEQARDEALAARRLVDSPKSKELLVNIETQWFIEPAKALRKRAQDLRKAGKSVEAVARFEEAMTALRDANRQAGESDVRSLALDLLKDVESEWLDEKYVAPARKSQENSEFGKAVELLEEALRQAVSPANGQRLQKVLGEVNRQEQEHNARRFAAFVASAETSVAAARDHVQSAKPQEANKAFEKAKEDLDTAQKLLDSLKTKKLAEVDALRETQQDLIAKSQTDEVKKQLKNVRDQQAKLQADLNDMENKWKDVGYDLHLSRGKAAMTKSTARKHFIEAQKCKNTSEVRLLIAQCEE